MKKHWFVMEYCERRSYTSLDEAVAAAKRSTSVDRDPYVVYEAMQVTQVPIPDITVTAVSA